MQEKTLGLIVAPGYVEAIIKELVEDLPKLLKRFVNSDITWKIECHVDSWTGGTNYAERAIEWTRFEMENKDWDYAITLTDLPLFDDRKPITAEVHSDKKIAFISLPGFGFTPMKKRVRESIIQMMDEIYFGSSDQERRESEVKQDQEEDNEVKYQGPKNLVGKRFFEVISPLRREVLHEKDSSVHARYTLGSDTAGLIKIISGMVNANRPFKLFQAFLKIVIIAFTTGTYALVFPTIWGLSTNYSVGRSILLMLAAIITLVVWIIISNNLWEKKTGEEQPHIRRLYNVTTVLTLLITVIMYYVLLFVMFLTIILLLIPPSQVAQNLSVDSVGLGPYLYTVWIGTSLSTFIGALGTAFNNEKILLNSTYGYRQQQRRKTTEEIEEEAEDD